MIKMGGSGSGTWYRWNKKTYAEEVKKIDMRYLKKQGLLKAGYSGSLTWTTNGEPSGDIRYVMWENEMRLLYKFRQNGGEWESVDETISFNETPCQFGGFRKWFTCPSCKKRVGILYGLSKNFRCRSCYGLAYESQSEGQLDRLTRKARKIRHKLDIDSDWWSPDCLSDPIFMRPSGMHQKTYERLKQAENRLQDGIESVFVSRYGHGWY